MITNKEMICITRQANKFSCALLLSSREIFNGFALSVTGNKNSADENSTHSKMTKRENNPSYGAIIRSVKLLDPCIRLEGEIVKGFGRGSKEIGCPTANLSEEVVENESTKKLSGGIYLGWAKLDGDLDMVEKAVVSVGWNPFYGNTKKSVETHIINSYDSDLYGRLLKLIICAYIRPELNFNSLDELVTAISDDIEYSKSQLDSQEELKPYKYDAFLIK